MNYYIYKVTHLTSKKFYIGKRTTDLNPVEDVEYLGSGTLIGIYIKFFGAESFIKEIISEELNLSTLNKREAELVTQSEVENFKCLNLIKGGTVSNHKMCEISHKKFKKNISYLRKLDPLKMSEIEEEASKKKKPKKLNLIEKRTKKREKLKKDQLKQKSSTEKKIIVKQSNQKRCDSKDEKLQSMQKEREKIREKTNKRLEDKRLLKNVETV